LLYRFISNFLLLYIILLLGIPVLEGYGLTETSPTMTASSIDWSNRRLGTVGVPLDSVDLMIVNPKTLEPLPSDTDGEVIQ
jgi:long-chain acyl-CoA synthetase